MPCVNERGDKTDKPRSASTPVWTEFRLPPTYTISQVRPAFCSASRAIGRKRHLGPNMTIGSGSFDGSILELLDCTQIIVSFCRWVSLIEGASLYSHIAV